jgi:hypothetical protein
MACISARRADASAVCAPTRPHPTGGGPRRGHAACAPRPLHPHARARATTGSTCLMTIGARACRTKVALLRAGLRTAQLALGDRCAAWSRARASSRSGLSLALEGACRRAHVILRLYRSHALVQCSGYTDRSGALARRAAPVSFRVVDCIWLAALLWPIALRRDAAAPCGLTGQGRRPAAIPSMVPLSPLNL